MEKVVIGALLRSLGTNFAMVDVARRGPLQICPQHSSLHLPSFFEPRSDFLSLLQAVG